MDFGDLKFALFLIGGGAGIVGGLMGLFYLFVTIAKWAWGD